MYIRFNSMEEFEFFSKNFKVPHKYNIFINGILNPSYDKACHLISGGDMLLVEFLERDFEVGDTVKIKDFSYSMAIKDNGIVKDCASLMPGRKDYNAYVSCNAKYEVLAFGEFPTDNIHDFEIERNDVMLRSLDNGCVCFSNKRFLNFVE